MLKQVVHSGLVITKSKWLKLHTLSRRSEISAVIGIFLCLAFEVTNDETQLTSPTENAYRNKCIIRNHAHKGLSVWKQGMFHLEATHNQHHDWKRLEQIKIQNPLHRNYAHQMQSIQPPYSLSSLKKNYNHAVTRLPLLIGCSHLG